MSGQGGVDAGQRHPFMSKSRFDRLSQLDKKASLAINHASEALSLCAMAKWENSTCPYISTTS